MDIQQMYLDATRDCLVPKIALFRLENINNTGKMVNNLYLTTLNYTVRKIILIKIVETAAGILDMDYLLTGDVEPRAAGAANDVNGMLPDRLFIVEYDRNFFKSAFAVNRFDNQKLAAGFQYSARFDQSLGLHIDRHMV